MAYIVHTQKSSKIMNQGTLSSIATTKSSSFHAVVDSPSREHDDASPPSPLCMDSSCDNKEPSKYDQNEILVDFPSRGRKGSNATWGMALNFLRESIPTIRQCRGMQTPIRHGDTSQIGFRQEHTHCEDENVDQSLQKDNDKTSKKEAKTKTSQKEADDGVVIAHNQWFRRNMNNLRTHVPGVEQCQVLCAINKIAQVMEQESAQVRSNY